MTHPPQTASIVLLIALASASCAKSETAQAKAGDTAKTVSVTVVHKDSVRRAVDVVGTLTAVDQVTVSSEADGKVRTIQADLGDRVKTGQVLVQLDNEKQQYTLRATTGRSGARPRAIRRDRSGTSAGDREDARRPTRDG